MTLRIDRQYRLFMRSDAPPLLPIFRSRQQADLLTWLLLHPEQEYSLSDVARRIGAPLTTVQSDARRLIDAGLLRSRKVGRSRLLRANVEHRATSPLTQLLTVTFGPHIIVAHEFSSLPGAELVLIYGSWAARYDGKSGSAPQDVDVLVVGNPDRGDVYDAADRVEDRIGLPVNPVVRTASQWVSDADPLIRQIKASPHHIVAGQGVVAP